jgi:hypothetical protein
MSSEGKGSAIGEMAANLGRGMAHTPPEISDEASAEDLFGFEVDAFAGQAIAPPKRGPGRPKGTPNRSTAQMAKLLAMRGYRDPLEFLPSIYTMDVRILAGELGCDLIAALQMQIRAASECLPYLHQRTPTQVEHSGDAGRTLIVINDRPSGAAASIGGASDAVEIIKQEQELSSLLLEKSHADKSHEVDNS